MSKSVPKKLKVKAESVEEFLARGGEVSKCEYVKTETDGNSRYKVEDLDMKIVMNKERSYRAHCNDVAKEAIIKRKWKNKSNIR